MLLFLACAGPAAADSWSPPETTITYSSNNMWRLIVTPNNPGVMPRSNRTKRATGVLEHRQGARWTRVWQRPLVNAIKPASALIADDGQHVVTFDNWGNIGNGDNVVVIYGGDGKLIRSLRLTQLIPQYYIDGLLRTYWSVDWQNEEQARIGKQDVTLFINGISSGPEGEPQYRPDPNSALPLRITLATGHVHDLTVEQRRAILPTACAAHRSKVAEYNGDADLSYQMGIFPTRLAHRYVAPECVPANQNLLRFATPALAAIMLLIGLAMLTDAVRHRRNARVSVMD